MADTLCRVAFPVPTGLGDAVLKEMLLYYLNGRADYGDTVLPLVEACALDDSPPNCADVLTMWIGLLRGVQLCSASAIWIPQHGCRCPDGFDCSNDLRTIHGKWEVTILLCVIITGAGVIVLLALEIQSQVKMLARTKSTNTLAQKQLSASVVALRQQSAVVTR